MTSVAVPAVQRQRWNTLQLLKLSRVVLLALDLLLLVAVIAGAGVHRESMQLVGKDTAPSIIAAQHIKSALAGMDADLATELVVPAGMAIPSLGDYDKHRVEGAEAMIVAAKNVTYDAEELPIEDLQVSTGTYERLAQQARDLADEGQADMSTRFYRAAGIIMDGTVLPAADELDHANHDVLEREYAARTTRSLLSRLLVGFAGLVTLVLLVAVQMFLSRRMRRTVNPALLVATVIALWLTVYAFGSMGREERDLRVAKEDAFTSTHVLWRARAMAYSANGSESRYLLDPLHAGEYEAEFFARTGALARLPQGLSAAQVEVAAARGEEASGFTGYLADELKNITFDGERKAAVETLAAFERYMAIDAEIRRLEKAGEHQKAVELCIGTSEGKSDWAFAQFDQALGRTLAINQDAFDASVKEGFEAVRNLEWKSSAAAVLIALLVWLGLAPRIREYE